MRLAETATGNICLGTESLLLRPSLRAACRLNRRYNGFEPLARAVADGTIHIIADCILETATDNRLSRDAIEFALVHNLAKLGTIIPQILSLIMALCGIDEDQPQQAKGGSSAKLESFADHYAKLFRIATGWLGWTPKDAWDATPQEIIEAFKGRSEMLAAIFGTGTPEREESNDYDNSTLDRQGLAQLKAMSGAFGRAA